MQEILSDYYRIPSTFGPARPSEEGNYVSGFSHFGKDILRYGECSSSAAPDVQAATDGDALQAVSISNSEIRLPFDVSKAIEILRKEHYVEQLNSARGKLTQHALIRSSYYFVRKLLPVWIRRHLQRAIDR